MNFKYNMLGKTEKSSDVCRTASLSEMGHKQRAATSSTVMDQRRKNFFVGRSSLVNEVSPNRHVLRIEVSRSVTKCYQSTISQPINMTLKLTNTKDHHTPWHSRGRDLST